MNDVASPALSRRLVIGGGLLTAASVGVPIFVPLAFPGIGEGFAKALLTMCGLIFLAGLLLFWGAWNRTRQSGSREIARRWVATGFGQGWIETRVRNNSGSEVSVSANPGDTAEKISLHVTFADRRMPKRSETVELVLEVDEEPFELDLTDQGHTTFGLDATTWRDVEALRQIVSSMRRGRRLSVSVPIAGLTAEFTLDGAHDVLEELEMLGRTDS